MGCDVVDRAGVLRPLRSLPHGEPLGVALHAAARLQDGRRGGGTERQNGSVSTRRYIILSGLLEAAKSGRRCVVASLLDATPGAQAGKKARQLLGREALDVCS